MQTIDFINFIDIICNLTLQNLHRRYPHAVPPREQDTLRRTLLCSQDTPVSCSSDLPENQMDTKQK